MVTKNFGDKKITIRKFSVKDIKRAKEFQKYINSLIKEKAKILLNEKLTLKEEKKWLEDNFLKIKKHKKVFVIAENNNKIIGETDIVLDVGWKGHVGKFGISIEKSYRGIGLGKCLMGEILKLAEKELKPKPKIIRIEVFSSNIPAIALYKKMGFKEVARVPKQLQYKGKITDETIMLLYL